MAPTKPRLPQDSPLPPTKSAPTNTTNPHAPVKMRRVNSTLTNPQPPPQPSEPIDAQPATSAPTPPPQGISWQTLPPSLLTTYAHAHRLPQPPCFSSPYNALILSTRPLAKHSPTMARKKRYRQQSREGLCAAVRKHFNDEGVVEGEVLVEFLYKVRFMDKAFRLRFAPGKGR